MSYGIKQPGATQLTTTLLPANNLGLLGGVKIGSNITVAADGTISVAAPGTGSVTSVGLLLPSEFIISGSPVTTSGTLTATKASQAANAVYAGPSSGAAAAPAFRSLSATDIPQVIKVNGTPVGV
jgi:hypothetical protein